MRRKLRVIVGEFLIEVGEFILPKNGQVEIHIHGDASRFRDQIEAVIEDAHRFEQRMSRMR